MEDDANAEPSLTGQLRTTERLSREKRMLITPSEELRLERLVIAMAERLKTSIKLSHLLRAAMMLLQEAEVEILGRCEMASPLKRPDNGSKDQLLAFERALADILKKSVSALEGSVNSAGVLSEI